ncbi:uncharacterized protein LOC144905498 [Branchiostoma floridae x Branchiostoma belcheri]
MIEEVLFCEERREGRVSCQQPSRSDRPWAGGEMARSLPATLHLSSGREVPVIYDVPCHVHFVPFPRGSNLPLPTNFSINVVGNQQRQVRPSRQEQHILTSTRNPEKCREELVCGPGKPGTRQKTSIQSPPQRLFPDKLFLTDENEMM